MSGTLVASAVGRKQLENPDVLLTRASFLTQYIVIIALTLLVYDYVLTFLNEVNWIWRCPNKRNLTIVLFFINRYLTILAIPIVVIHYFWQNTDPGRLTTCLTVNKVHYYIIIFSQVIVAAVLVSRAYALYGKSRWVLALTCGITIVAASLAVWSVVTAPTPAYSPKDLWKKGTCMLPTELATVERYMSAIIVASILELVVFALIACKSIQHISSHSVILEILLRDGLFYFATVMLAHFGVILSYYLFSDAMRGNLAVLANCLNSAVISRLILHLRDPALNPRYQPPTQATQGILSTVVMADGRDGSTQDSYMTESSDYDCKKWYSSTGSSSYGGAGGYNNNYSFGTGTSGSYGTGSYSVGLESRTDYGSRV